MTENGAILSIITIITFLVLLTFSLIFYYKKITWKWWYTSIIALCFLLYFLFGRYITEIKNCIDYDWNKYAPTKNDTSNSFDASILISKAFLLDMCPFMCFFICILSLTKYTQNYAKILAPIGFFISLFTILLAIGTMQFQLTWQFVMLGKYPNLMFFMMHYLMFILSSILIFSTRKYRLKHFVIAYVSILVFIAYVFIVKTITGVNWNLTGLTKNDWIIVSQTKTIVKYGQPWIQTVNYEGEYYNLGRFFHLNWPSGPIFLFLISAILITLMMLFINWIKTIMKKNLLKKQFQQVQKIKIIL